MDAKFFLRASRLVRLTIFLTVFAALGMGYSSSAANAPQLSGNIKKIYVSNITDLSFDVTWTTGSPNNNSSVNFGTSPTTLNQNAPDTVTGSKTTHYVTVNHGLPNTTIYFEVLSGGEIDDNGGAKYQVTSGPNLGAPPAGKDLTGTVYKSGGGTAANVIVYIQLQDVDGLGSPGNSEWGTVLTSSTGTWSFNLDSLRTADASAYYAETYGTDNMRIVWQGGADGCIGEKPNDLRIYTTPTTFPAVYNMNLDGVPNAVKMASLRVYNGHLFNFAIFYMVGLIGISSLMALLGWRWLRRTN